MASIAFLGDYVIFGKNQRENAVPTVISATCLTVCTSGDDCYKSGETTYYWDPENGADQDSIPEYGTIRNVGGIDIEGSAYNWFAAIAGSNNAIGSGKAPDSTCPAGWKLPMGDTSGNATSGSYYYLLAAYGYTSTSGSGNAGTRLAMQRLPMAFTFTYDTGTEVGGALWSKTNFSINESKARSLLYRTSVVHTSYGEERTLFKAVRCILPIGE